MNEPIRVSGKHLAELAMPDHCLKCFHLKLKCGWRVPFSIFPSIFSVLDSHVKRVVAAHYAIHNRLPPWLPCEGTLLPSFHWSKFGWRDEVSNTLLVGAPDELVRRRDGSLAVLDYKTQRHSEAADKLFQLYATQINSYGVIAQHLGLGRPSQLALVYCEPAPLDADDPLAVYRGDGFSMNFTTKTVPVQLEPESIQPMLVRVREIADMPCAPAGRVGCKDCARLEAMIEHVTKETAR